MAKKVTIAKDRSLTSQEVLKLLADVTEQPTQKPVKKQKKSYSGKKRRHTIKTEIIVKDDVKFYLFLNLIKGGFMILKSVKGSASYLGRVLK